MPQFLLGYFIWSRRGSNRAAQPRFDKQGHAQEFIPSMTAVLCRVILSGTQALTCCSGKGACPAILSGVYRYKTSQLHEAKIARIYDMQKLTEEKIQARLASLDGWQADGTAIWKAYEFADFDVAMDFMNQLASTAATLNHHPDWSNSYNKVSIRLTSHEAGGLTESDFAFADAAEVVAKRLL